MLQADLKKRIRLEVEKLPEKQRIALTLRVFEDLSFKEIAAIMECPYDTAKANYRHALLKLRERLEQEDTLQAWSVFENRLPTEASDMATTRASGMTEAEQ